MKAKNEKTELSQGDLDQLYEEFRNGKSLTNISTTDPQKKLV